MKNKVKKLLLIFGATILVVITVLFVISSIKKSHQVTDLELEAFNEKSTKLMNYFEEIDTDGRDELSRQTSYALQTLYAENPKQSYSLSEVQDTITNSFTDPVNINDSFESGNIPEVMEVQMIYDDQQREFLSSKDALTHKDIIDMPITKYILTSVKKRKNTYIASYEKYVFEEPYMIIDRTSKDETHGEHSVADYLAGKGTDLALKELLNSSNAKDICEPEKTITVTFQIDNDILKIQDYK